MPVSPPTPIPSPRKNVRTATAPITRSKKLIKKQKININIPITDELGKPSTSLSSFVFQRRPPFLPVATPTPSPPDGTSSYNPKLNPNAFPFAPKSPIGRISLNTPPIALKVPKIEPPAKLPPTPRPTDDLPRLIKIATANFQNSTTWQQFFDLQRDPKGDLGPVETLQHPARDLLTSYKHQGVPVKMDPSTQWNSGQKQSALERGPHKSVKEHLIFLREEYTDMINKGHWALLPAKLLLQHPDL